MRPVRSHESDEVHGINLPTGSFSCSSSSMYACMSMTAGPVHSSCYKAVRGHNCWPTKPADMAQRMQVSFKLDADLEQDFLPGDDDVEDCYGGVGCT